MHVCVQYDSHQDFPVAEAPHVAARNSAHSLERLATGACVGYPVHVEGACRAGTRKPRAPTESSSQLVGSGSVLRDLTSLLKSARRAAARSVNAVTVRHLLPRGPVHLRERAEGRASRRVREQLLRRLGADLTATFGRGFSLANPKSMRLFYVTYRDQIGQTTSGQLPSSKIRQTASGQLEHGSAIARFALPWSHYVLLLGARSSEARAFNEAESLRGGWTVRQLRRQIGTQFYERRRVGSA